MIGRAFRERALRDHTYVQRAAQVEAALEGCVQSGTLLVNA